jgi:signal transduction histidine kinase
MTRVPNVSSGGRTGSAGGNSGLGAFATTIAESMRASHVELAARWLQRLHDLLPVPVAAVFPSSSLLDHIPDLIEQIAGDIASGSTEALVTNTSVIRKAQELGELRYRQQASVHQLLREYRLLADVLNAFVDEEVVRLNLDTHASEALAVAARLHEAVFLLMQTTVDTFVALYADTVTRQNTRLEGFNRMITHELRQPLGTIRSAVEVVRSGDTTPEARDRCIDLIETNSRRMAAMTTRLLTLSTLDADSIQTQEADFGRLVEDAAGQLDEMAARRGVAVRRNVPPIRLVTDVARVELILVNLVSNAIKYSDPAKADRFVEITAAALDEDVQLIVRDNGVGIPRAHLNRVFEAFYRAHSARDSELGADGIGLGLAIVTECARHLGATLAIDSEDGSGTTLSVRLPLRCAVAPLSATKAE